MFWKYKVVRQSMKPKRKPKSPFDMTVFLTKANRGRATAEYRTNDRIFVQGDPANAVFYIKEGKVKLTVLSKQGKEAVVAILGVGDFFGEGCLAGQLVRMGSAVSMSMCSITKLEKTDVIRALHEEPGFSEVFVAHLLSRNVRIEEDLVNQLFNSSEKRLARVLLLRSEEHTSELQSLRHLVCRLLLEKKKNK